MIREWTGNDKIAVVADMIWIMVARAGKFAARRAERAAGAITLRRISDFVGTVARDVL
jgi:hypothetical protein